MSGLFELVSSKNDGAIVKNLQDSSTQFVSSRKHQFSHLESIEIYTRSGNVNLVEVFQAISADKETALPEPKDAKALKAYFEKIYPEMDFERVYMSDMKKMVRWYAQIEAVGIEPKLRAAEDKPEGITSEEDPTAK